MNNAPGPPNIPLMASHLRDVSEHVERFQNLPAIDNGVQIMQTLQRILERLDQMDARFDRVDARFAQMEERMTNMEENFHHGFATMSTQIENLTGRVSVMESNAIIRLENSTASRGDADLVPLLSANTGLSIEGCPAKVGDLMRLPGLDVNNLLAQLDLPIMGGVEARKRRLLRCMGVVTLAT